MLTQSKKAFSRNCYLGDFYFRYSPHRLPHWPLIGPAIPAQNELNQSKRRTVGPETKRQNSQQNEKKIRRGGSAEFSGKTPTNPRTKRCCAHWIAVVMETWTFTYRFTLLQVCWMVGCYLRHDLQLFERSNFPRICKGRYRTRFYSGTCSGCEDGYSTRTWPRCAVAICFSSVDFTNNRRRRLARLQSWPSVAPMFYKSPNSFKWNLFFTDYSRNLSCRRGVLFFNRGLHKQPDKTICSRVYWWPSLFCKSSDCYMELALQCSSLENLWEFLCCVSGVKRIVAWISGALLTNTPQFCGKNHKKLSLFYFFLS